MRMSHLDVARLSLTVLPLLVVHCYLWLTAGHSTSCQIFLNLDTREEKSYTISLNSLGFSVMRRRLNRAELGRASVLDNVDTVRLAGQSHPRHSGIT